MTQREMIENIRQHHPHIKEVEARKLLNRASDVFCAETEIARKSWIQNSTADKRYYGLDADIVRVIDVWVDDERIKRLVTPPPIEDDDYA